MTRIIKKEKVPSIVAAVFIAGLLLPFIFFKSVYPFYRFGMFAEPMTGKEKKTESFFSTYLLNGQSVVFDPESIGMTDSQWESISRSHFYQKNSEQLLQKLQPLIEYSTDWHFFRVVWEKEKSDTTLVFSQNEHIKNN